MKNTLTTSAGCPVADNQNTMTAGPRGPQLLQDAWLLENWHILTGRTMTIIPSPVIYSGL